MNKIQDLLIFDGEYVLSSTLVGNVLSFREYFNDVGFVGILLSSSSAGTSPSESYPVGSSGSTPQSLPTFQHPSHSLLKENNFKQEVYSKYYSRCLKGMVIVSVK